MDYEKKYNEALEKARMYRDNAKAVEEYAAVARYENIFPELRESEDERISDTIFSCLHQCCNAEFISEKQRDDALAWLEKQKEIPMPNSTELIEMWHAEKAMLKEKDFRGDEWRLAYNAFMGGFARGTCVKIEKQKEQKPVEKQDYSGLTDLERAIHRGFLCAGIENVPVTIIKETARDFLAQMKPAEWSEEDSLHLANAILSAEKEWGTESCTAKWLKSLRPSWKPSEEQMAWLKLAIDEAKEPLKSQLEELYKNIRENLIWK